MNERGEPRDFFNLVKGFYKEIGVNNNIYGEIDDIGYWKSLLEQDAQPEATPKPIKKRYIKFTLNPMEIL